MKLYSLPFVRNRKRELNINYHEATSLRSFVEQKLINLSKYTTLSSTNQMEIILNDLPAEISALFITNEKMTCAKADILDFCESIQDFADTLNETVEEECNEEGDPSRTLNRMEVFNFTREAQPSLLESESMMVDEMSNSGRGGGKTRGRKDISGVVKKRGRPKKKLEIAVIEESSDYDFLSQVDDTTTSTWSDGL